MIINPLKLLRNMCFMVFLIFGWLSQVSASTAFTYQGQLKNASGVVTSTCQMQFSLYDAATGGSQVGTTVSKTDLSVVNGLFTTQLDFGSSAFDGNARWLEIAVQCGSDSAMTTLSRQALTSVPYAIHALSVSSIGTAQITDANITEDKLAANLTFDDGDLLDLSAINASGIDEGLILPQATDVSAATAVGQISWDSDDNKLYVGDGAAAKEIGAGGTLGSSIESSQITDNTIVDADINSSAAIASTKIGGGTVDNTEFSHLDGVTSAIQTQLNLKGTGDVTLTGSQTLTNKTLTSPTVNTPTISGGTVDNSVIGGTTPAAGTFTTLTANTGATIKNGTAAGKIDIFEASGDGTEKVTLQTQAMGADYTLTLPADDGINGQVLQTDGSGFLSWTTVSSGGSDVVNDTTPQLGGQLDVNGNSLGDGTNELLKFNESAAAVNEITVTNAATGNAPKISATGDDANVDLVLDTKGTGQVEIAKDGSTVFLLPNTDGTPNQVLQTDGSGAVSWATVGGGANLAKTVNGGGTTSLGTCTNSILAPGSNDHAGKITLSGSSNTCKINFGTTYTAAGANGVSCVATLDYTGAAVISAISTTSVTLIVPSYFTAGDAVYYLCMGY